LSTDESDNHDAAIVCATCKKHIPARSESRCMACGAPTCSRCTTAGLCKDDIDRIWTRAGEQLVAIDHAMKRARRMWIVTAVADLGLIYSFIIPLFVNIVDVSWLLEGGNLYMFLVILLIPVSLLLFVQYHFMSKFKNAIRARDEVLRDANIELNYQPRKGYLGRDGKLVTYSCGACHGPVHVNHATCAICYIALCPKCVSQSLCPAHAAALSNDEKEQLAKSGDFPLRMVLYTIPLVFSMLVFMVVYETFDLPVIFIMFPLLFVMGGDLKLLSTMHSRQQLRKKYKDVTNGTRFT